MLVVACNVQLAIVEDDGRVSPAARGLNSLLLYKCCEKMGRAQRRWRVRMWRRARLSPPAAWSVAPVTYMRPERGSAFSVERLLMVPPLLLVRRWVKCRRDERG